MTIFKRHPAFAAAVLAFAALSPIAQAAAVFTTDFTAFNTANLGLAVETFENANLVSGTNAVIASPLNASSNNAVFATGSVLPGFSLGVTAGNIYVSRDFGGNSGANVSSNGFAENINISFSPGVTSIGIDLLQWNGNNGGWLLEAFDAANLSLGTFSTNAGSFIGLVSDVDVARLFLDKPDSGAVIDNLRFGAVSTVAEPGTLASVVLALGLLGATRRRKR